MTEYCENFTKETLKKWAKAVSDISFDYLEGDIDDKTMVDALDPHGFDCLIEQTLGVMADRDKLQADNKILVAALKQAIAELRSKREVFDTMGVGEYVAQIDHTLFDIDELLEDTDSGIQASLSKEERKAIVG